MPKQLSPRRPNPRRLAAIRTLRYEPLESRRLLSVYYVDATGGNDSYTGVAGYYAGGTTGPWRSLTKVNSQTFAPGDTILFKRGETWRGQLFADSGSSSSDVTYGAYGDVALSKPQILGSVEANNTTDWINLGNNLWTTNNAATVDGSEMLGNPSFSRNSNGWGMYCSGAASATGYRDATVYDSSPAGYSIRCASNGSDTADIQFFTTAGMSITMGECYVLTFRAKCTVAFTFTRGIQLLQTSSPWANYQETVSGNTPSITTSWTTYTIIFQANTTATDAGIRFYLGDQIPDGATFSIDTLSLKHCAQVDVGNIIFNNGESCGVKRWHVTDASATPDGYTIGLHNQGDFYYDRDTCTVTVYSTTNPASHYSDIELALNRNIIENAANSHVTYKDLELLYGAQMGISAADASYVTVQDCDLGFIGGGLQVDDPVTGPVRFGNGIQFWGSTHDILVEGCRIWDIYDAGVTNQSSSGAEYNITYRNNIIWNCEYSYEYFLFTTDSTASNIYFENNTCAYAGSGWGHSQRPNGANGRHLMFWSNSATVTNFYIVNNIFYESSDSAIRLDTPWTDVANLTLDYNLYYESSGYVACWAGVNYTLTQFAAYQTASGKDAHSIATSTNAVFVNPSARDFHLLSTSSAVDMGLNTGKVTTDHNGTARPQGSGIDVGAYECSTPIVESVVINDGSAQRSKVTSLAVKFNQVVTLASGAFAVLDKTTGTYVTVATSVSTVGNCTVVTLTFSGSLTQYGSLIDGDYKLIIDSSKVTNTATAAHLDGDDDGTAGGNYIFGGAAVDRFFRLYGDSDGDRDVDASDFARFRLAMGRTSGQSGYLSYFDYDGDGDVDATDFARFRTRMDTTMAFVS